MRGERKVDRWDQKEKDKKRAEEETREGEKTVENHFAIYPDEPPSFPLSFSFPSLFLFLTRRGFSSSTPTHLSSVVHLLTFICRDRRIVLHLQTSWFPLVLYRPPPHASMIVAEKGKTWAIYTQKGGGRKDVL